MNEMIAMRGEAIGIGLHIRQLGWIAHADQIRRDQAALPFKLGDHIAPEIGRGWIAVQEQDRRAATLMIAMRWPRTSTNFLDSGCSVMVTISPARLVFSASLQPWIGASAAR
jgi:hypothetical protein